MQDRRIGAPLVLALATASPNALAEEPTSFGFGVAGTVRYSASLAGAGDVDGDGFADVIVGANRIDDLTAEIYWHPGAVDGMSVAPGAVLHPTADPDVHLEGPQVAAAGDVNGDGYPDVVVGLPESDDFGQVNVYHGSAAGLSTSPATLLLGTPDSDRLGWSVAGAGDVNGDGYDDIVASATFGASARGAAHVYAGSPSGIGSTPLVELPGEDVYDYFGLLVAGAGDLNGDGYDDLLVSARDAASGLGRVYLYTGSPTGPSPLPNAWRTGRGDGATPLGAAAGDLNGDGYDDAVVWTQATSSSGAAIHVLHGSPTGPRHAAAIPVDAVDWAAAAGDVNADGFGDLVAGDSGFEGHGLARIYPGSAGGISREATRSLVTSGAGGELLGHVVAGAGDVDGDGIDDWLAGAPGPTSPLPPLNGSSGDGYIQAGSPDLQLSAPGRAAPGQRITVEASGAVPGARVSLYAGSEARPGEPCPANGHGLCVGLRQARLLAEEIADPSGRAEFEVAAPGGIPAAALRALASTEGIWSAAWLSSPVEVRIAPTTVP